MSRRLNDKNYERCFYALFCIGFFLSGLLWGFALGKGAGIIS